MATYDALKIGVVPYKSGNLQLLTMVALEVGDTLVIPEYGEALVYAIEKYPMRITGKACEVEVFTLEFGPNRYRALGRTTHKGRIHIAL